MSDRAAELTTLCRSCGVCCNGVMFAHVQVTTHELRPETRRRLQVVEADGRFKPPCAAHEPRGCTVYDDRPEICRDYACELYLEHEAKGGELDRKLRRVARIRELVASIRARRKVADREWLPRTIAEMLSIGKPSDVEPDLMLDIAELAMRLQRDFGWNPKPEPEPEPDAAKAP